MTEPLPIYKDQDFYVPMFEVKVGERPLERDVVRDITQVSYKDSLQEIDSFEITINNWDAEKRTFKYSDGGVFDPGKKVELWMGYFGHEKLRLMLTGEITSLRPTFPAGGQPTLSISGLNLLHRLRKKQESHAYEGKTDKKIAEEIAGRLDVKIEPENLEEGEEYPYILQNNQYDIIFLMERARRIGYDLFVIEQGDNGQSQESKLYFGPSDKVNRTTYELKYGLSLIDFQPNLTTANQVGKVTVFGWDSTKKEPIKETVTRADLTTQGVGSEGGQEVIEQSFQREEIIVDKPIHSKQEAKTLARETLENIAKDMVKGSGSVVGLPDLRAGGVLFISGLGKRFSGRYFVTGTNHSIGDSGYTTKFECRREELES